MNISELLLEANRDLVQTLVTLSKEEEHDESVYFCSLEPSVMTMWLLLDLERVLCVPILQRKEYEDQTKLDKT